MRRLQRYHTVKDKFPLSDFRLYQWSDQQHALQPILQYMKIWGQWRVDYFTTDWKRRLEDEAAPSPQKPAPIIHIHGGSGLGKTEILGAAIICFMVSNLAFISWEYVHWPTYMEDQNFGPKEINPNWNADILFVDDFDRYRPVQKTLSTWILQKLLVPIKTRKMPLILTTNRTPDQLEAYFSNNIYKESNQDVSDFVKMLTSSISRSTAFAVGLNPAFGKSNPKRDEALRSGALKQSDGVALKLMFPVKNKWVQEVYL